MVNAKSRNGKTILLAEDDAAVRRLLEVVLERAGYTVISAEDGAIALQKALENSFDIAVLDAIMPNLNGYELCRILRQQPTLKNLPLVILSGLESETITDADVCLVKTFDLQNNLLTVVANLLAPENYGLASDELVP